MRKRPDIRLRRETISLNDLDLVFKDLYLLSETPLKITYFEMKQTNVYSVSLLIISGLEFVEIVKRFGLLMLGLVFSLNACIGNVKGPFGPFIQRNLRNSLGLISLPGFGIHKWVPISNHPLGKHRV